MSLHPDNREWADVIAANLTGVYNTVQAFLEADPILASSMANALPVDLIEPSDVSNADLWLVSDDARYVTGVVLPVDAGFSNKK